MCKCDPTIKSPVCGKGDCVYPPQKVVPYDPELALRITQEAKFRLRLTQQAFDSRLDYWQARAVQLVNEASADGVIVTVERVSVPPLAMGNHVPVVTVREKR